MLELGVIVNTRRLVPLALEFPDLGLDFSLIQAHDLVILVQIQTKRLAKRPKQVVLVHLGVALHCLVALRLCDVAKLGHRLPLEFLVCVSHILTSRWEGRSRWIPSAAARKRS